jgi:L-asparagine oxygenase
MSRTLTRTTGDFVTVLTDREREAIRKIASRLDESGPDFDLDDPELVTRVDVSRRHLPGGVVALLSQFRRKSNQYGSMLIRNLPVDDKLPPTPQDGRSKEKQTHISELTLMLVMSCLGDVIAYADEKEGRLVQDICPIPGKEAKQENGGSVLLEFHTEDGFHPYKPDFLGLLCLRSDHENIAATYTASIRRAIERLPGRMIELLFQPQFYLRLSSSFGASGGNQKTTDLLPVLTGDLRDPDMTMDFFLMEARNRAAKYALDALGDALKEVAVDVRAVPGDLLIVDNKLAVHGRSSFTPRYDGRDRWLQRMFIVRDLRRSRASRPNDSHVCTPLFVEFADPDDVIEPDVVVDMAGPPPAPDGPVRRWGAV